MINFTDPRLYLKGTCSAIASDPVTGEIYYYDNKFQTGNVSTSSNMGEIRAGLGNGIATIIPSDSDVNVEFNSASFNLWAKSAQVGAKLNYNAPVMRCKVIVAEGSSLSVDVTEGAPVAQMGYSKPFGYVTTSGKATTIAEHGVPYEIDPDSGLIKGFSAQRGVTYKVFYFTNQANARIATIGTLFNPRVVHFTAQMAVYSNEGALGDNEGTLAGWLYVIIPRLKLSGNGGVNGDQTSNDTTSMSGKAVAFDSDVQSYTCSDCDSSELAYYIYSPKDESENITGLAIVGGVIDVAAQGTVQVPVKMVMANGELVTPNYNDLTYKMVNATAISDTQVSTAGVITAGSKVGTGEITCSVTENPEISVVANVVVSGE